jgi:ABC-type xylose transport system permease subunit
MLQQASRVQSVTVEKWVKTALQVMWHMVSQNRSNNRRSLHELQVEPTPHQDSKSMVCKKPIKVCLQALVEDALLFVHPAVVQGVPCKRCLILVLLGHS